MVPEARAGLLVAKQYERLASELEAREPWPIERNERANDALGCSARPAFCESPTVDRVTVDDWIHRNRGFVPCG
jgi:hypothetical protein